MTKDQYTIVPQVNPEREFVEIATDFSNPLEIVREMISNSFDACAKSMNITFSVEKDDEGEDNLKIVFEDNGNGISRDEMHHFFDLGNSSRRNDPAAIGEKGHGTKVAFNSSRIEVDSVSVNDRNTRIVARVDKPLALLNAGKMPKVHCEASPYSGEKESYTKITVWGYNRNRRDRFYHLILKDYIYWFTKFGSFELLFGHEKFKDFVINLHGLSAPGDRPEVLQFGHPFPPESVNINKLFDQHMADAPDHYCQQVKKEGVLPNFPEIRYQAFFSVEGDAVKRGYNKLLRRPGVTIPNNAGYKVQDRYGLWLCKDFIPIQRENSWVAPKGSEYTRLHAFFNCQGFNLTANRGSVNNTESEKIAEVEKVVTQIFDEICNTDGWRNFDWLESQSAGYKAGQKEGSEYRRRIRDFNQTKVASFRDRLLVEPRSENGVYGLVVMLSTLAPDVFPFSILDYNTRVGIDLIVKGAGNGGIGNATPFYVELKHFLKKDMNHSFENIHTIVCWQTNVHDGAEVVDVQEKHRVMHVVSAEENPDGYTKYLLDAPASHKKIECIVLEQYLREKLEIHFRARKKEEQVPVPAK